MPRPRAARAPARPKRVEVPLREAFTVRVPELTTPEERLEAARILVEWTRRELQRQR